MTDTRTKIGHGLAKVLGIKLDYREDGPKPNVTRGESVFSVASADSYVEDEPSVLDWINEKKITTPQILSYLSSLFPFTQWLPRYNLQWFIGDLIAGVTIGAVVVPQGMGYAKLALLDVQYGLYSAFMGVLIYWLFATSKDITIGPVAVMSLLTGDVIDKVTSSHPHIPPQDIAATLAIIGGAIVFFIGIVRLGWLTDFISLAAVSAFITGSALNIAIGQVPNIFGISDYFNTRASPYLVVIHTLQNLHHANINTALGGTALLMLYSIRAGFNYLAKKQPQRRKFWFFLNTLRTVFVILLYTLISYLCNRHIPRTSDGADDAEFAILGPVPRGFTAAGVPNVNIKIIKLVASELPAVVIVLLIEHISIAKQFGRINNYTINPSQELMAIGVTNLLTPFLGGYPSTGSFSRTAIKSKAGVRTPLAGVITAIVVLLAIYALPPVFFYIPSAGLAAVIIHAVGDLITPPNTVYQFWRVSPIEVPIFLGAVIIMMFTTIEIGVYVVVAVSAALLLFRIFRAQGRFLGKVTVHSVVGDPSAENSQVSMKRNDDKSLATRDIFLPIDSVDASNPLIKPQHPHPGVFIFRFSEGFNYPNANHYFDYMIAEIQSQCQRTTANNYARKGDRPWNEPVVKDTGVADNRPTLKAIILDFSSVNNVDITSVQILIDVRNQLDRFVAPDRVQWHFAHITNRWTRRALAAAGFGFPTPGDSSLARWKPVFSITEIGGSNSAAAEAEVDERMEMRRQSAHHDIEQGRPHNVHGNIEVSVEADSNNEKYGGEPHISEKQLRESVAYPESADSSAGNGGQRQTAVVHGLNRPFFHVDLTSALQSAVYNSEALSGAAGRVEAVVGSTGQTPDVTT